MTCGNVFLGTPWVDFILRWNLLSSFAEILLLSNFTSDSYETQPLRWVANIHSHWDWTSDWFWFYYCFIMSRSSWNISTLLLNILRDQGPIQQEHLHPNSRDSWIEASCWARKWLSGESESLIRATGDVMSEEYSQWQLILSSWCLRGKQTEMKATPPVSCQPVALRPIAGVTEQAKRIYLLSICPMNWEEGREVKKFTCLYPSHLPIKIHSIRFRRCVFQ